MSNDDVYSMISEILALAGKYSGDAFRAARVHVKNSFQGHDQRALLRIIETLEALVDERSRSQEAIRPRQGPRADDHELQEFAAILQDPAFLSKKADLLSVLNKVMGKGALKASSKDSREAVVRKALQAFHSMPAAARSRVYRTVHARFMKGRGSTLKDWSDIISE